MIPEASLRPGLHPSIVLSAYIEPLVRGRRVAVLGDSSIGLADELSQRGARLVHVYDPDTARTAEALARAAPGRPHQVAYAVFAGDLGVRDGAFDVVVVPDLAIFTDAADVLRRARRLCSPAGVAVFVAPNAGASGKRLLGGAKAAEAPKVAPVGYYELYDLVSLQFAKVRMIGQAPFVGYTVADFTLGRDPEVSVDTSLLASSEEPEHFIALASERPVSLDSYAVIELPWQDVADAIAPSGEAASARSAERLALAEAEARVALLAAEIEKLRERATEEAREAAARAPVAAALSARVAELEGEVATRENKLRESEARAGDNHVRAERLTNQIRDLDEELRRQRDRGTKLSKLLDDEKKARTKAEVELGMLRGSAPAPGSKERIDALVAELAASQARVGELELEIVETRRRPAADSSLITRLAEVEHALEAAQRERAEVEAQRNAAFERAMRAEARVESATAGSVSVEEARREKAELSARVGEIAAALEEARREKAELSARVGEAAAALEEARREKAELSARASEAAELSARVKAATAEVADLERRLLAERERATAAAKMASDGVRRLADVEREAGDASARASKLAHALGDAEKRVAELTAVAADRDRKLASIAAAHEADRAQAAEASEARAAAEAAAAEIAALEAMLVERGRTIAALTRDLRESERVGRELVGELTAPSSSNGASHGAPDELRGRLDALAQSAARSEADLTAATWRIAQLERELTAAQRAPGQPSRVERELEEALAAARDEVAALRRALSGGVS